MSEFLEVFKEALGLTLRVSVWALINYCIWINRRAFHRVIRDRLRGYTRWDAYCEWMRKQQEFKDFCSRLMRKIEREWEPVSQKRIGGQING